MKKLIAIAVIIMASATSFASGMATLDVNAVINNANATARANSVLQEKAEEVSEKVKKLEEPLIKRQQDLEAKRGVVSEDKFLEAESELRRDVREFKADVAALKEELAREKVKLQRVITDELRKVVDEIAKERELTAVLPRNLMLFSTDAIDISKEVLDRVNKNLD